MCLVPQRVQLGSGSRFRARMLGGRATRPVEDTCHSLPKGPLDAEHARTCEVSGRLPRQKLGGREALSG